MGQVLPVLILLGGLIFIHELGHFLVAKAFKVKVVRFSLGFGPRLIGFRWGETDYRISLLPLGGYVKMAGDDPTEALDVPDRGRGYLEQSPYKRILIALAGPGFNLLFPILAYFVVFSLQGQGIAPHVGTVVPGMPAAEAGLQPGDRIVEVEGEPVYGFQDLTRLVAPAAGRPLQIVVERDGSKQTFTITPESHAESDPIETVQIGRIGVSPNSAAPVIGVSDPESAAWKGGLRTFDRVVAVAGQQVETLEQAIARLEAQGSGDAPYEVTVLRPVAGQEEGQTLRFTLEPGPVGVEGAELYVANVQAEGAAARAGLQRGDRIVSMDGKRLRTWQELDAVRQTKQDRPFELGVIRDGEPLQIVMSQDMRVEQDEIRGRPVEVYTFGATGGQQLLPPPVVDLPFRPALAAKLALSSTWEVTRKITLGIGKLFTGQISLKNVGGPIQIYDVATKAAQHGWEMFLHTMAMISINLGLLNLLPVPVLDGGHIVQASVEAVRRKPLSIRTREIANLVGLGLLLALMVFALKNDVVRFFFSS